MLKIEFPGTKRFIKERLEEECSKENISVEEVFFLFYVPRIKKLAQKNIFYFVLLGFKAEMLSLYLTKYETKFMKPY